MGDCLILGDYTYSSWSLRGWLLMERFGLPFSVQNITFLHGPVATQVARIAPARTVPALVTDDGTVIWDSLAMAEELASRHPEAGHWPSDPAARATARSMAAEMHSSFGALREQCPMNLQAAYTGFTPTEETLADLARIETLWAFARERFGDGGPWLFGRYSAADAFFAPVAARIAGYRLPVGAGAAGYVAEHLADPCHLGASVIGHMRDAKIQHLRSAVFPHQDVGRLEIAMDHTLEMRRMHRTGNGHD